MSFLTLLSGLQSLLGVAEKYTPKASITTKIGVLPATINAATLQAGLKVLMGLDTAEIKRQWQKGQIVTAGAITLDDALKIVAPIVPGVQGAEVVLATLVFLGEHSLAHNSGENGIGAKPEGNGNVTV